MSRDYDNAHLCAISLLRVWIDLIDSSGIDWKRFPDMSIDISECAIKLEKKEKRKKLNFSWWMKMELSSIFFSVPTKIFINNGYWIELCHVNILCLFFFVRLLRLSCRFHFPSRRSNPVHETWKSKFWIFYGQLDFDFSKTFKWHY